MFIVMAEMESKTRKNLTSAPTVGASTPGKKGQIVVEDWPSEAVAQRYLCSLLRIFGIS